MVVVNETAGDETASEEAAGFSAKPELSNRWFRAYRIALGPGEKTAAHRHRAPVAIIQATAGQGRGEGAMTFEFNEPGQWAYFDADAAHEVRNVGEGTVEFIEVEVRRK
jgi:quercetin dioxygenase-like cupin family protein